MAGLIKLIKDFMSANKQKKSEEVESAVNEQATVTVIVSKQVKEKKSKVQNKSGIMIFGKE